jgi:hypothetical protein
MMNISSNSILDAVMELAAQEATSAGFPEITPAHLLMALSKICEAPPPSGAIIDEVRREFQQLGIEPRTFRRRLRAIVGSRGAHPSDGIMHRSDSCRAIFSLAERVANREQTSLEPVHLLRSAFLSLAESRLLGDSGGSSIAEEIPAEL